MFDSVEGKESNIDYERKFTKKEQELARFSEQIAFQANHEEEQQVPHWHRADAFEKSFPKNSHQQLPWWQWQGMSALSMACSAATIALVLIFFKPSNEFDKQAFSVLVTEEVNKRLMEQESYQVPLQVDGVTAALVDLKLRDFAAEQQIMLANYRADMASKQQSNNLQLASYILDASRQERKEDIVDFIGFINEQRKDEQLDQKIKYEQLEREISFKKLNYQFKAKSNSQSNQKNVTKTQLAEES